MAEDEPETVQGLLLKEIANNWIVETSLSIADARKKWPLGIAVGKLNVVFAEGKEPRLVLDSTVCQVNTRCHLPERLSLPMASDLALSTQPEDTPGAFIGASVDFKAAHKQVQVRPEEHGLLLFAFQGKLYRYRVCHFGGRFSAFWWQRTGAFLLRQVHGLLAWKPHKAFLFVDDLLCALVRDSAPDMFALVVLFFCAVAAPISWKKVQFQDSLVWCGWEINFSHDTIQLMSSKLAKLDALIKSLLGSRRVPRKTLEQCIGLLIWATSIALHLRSWLAPLYADLNSPPGSMHSIPPQMWSAFRASLSRDLKTSHSLPGLWITAGSKILEISGRALHCLEDIPRVPGTSKPTWVRIADPNNPYTSLSKSSQHCLTWLASCFRHSPIQPLARPHQLQALAAADACAEDEMVGIGGWAITSSQVVSFAETWNMQDIRAVWPCLVKPAQRYIACFETLAQLALLQATHSHIGGGHYSFSMPSGTDNSATEASLNKLFTTSWPLQLFVQLTAFWAHAHNVLLQPTHVPGRCNDWADDLSRGRLTRFSHRPESRMRFSPASLAMSGRGIQLCPMHAPWRPEHLAAASIVAEPA